MALIQHFTQLHRQAVVAVKGSLMELLAAAVLELIEQIQSETALPIKDAQALKV
jgi:hypothetical protein